MNNKKSMEKESSYRVTYSKNQAYISVENNPTKKKIAVAVYSQEMIDSLIDDKEKSFDEEQEKKELIEKSAVLT